MQEFRRARRDEQQAKQRGLRQPFQPGERRNSYDQRAGSGRSDESRVLWHAAHPATATPVGRRREQGEGEQQGIQHDRALSKRGEYEFRRAKVLASGWP